MVAIFLVFLYTLEYGNISLRKLSLTGDEDADLGSKLDESSSKFGQEDGEDDVIPKSFPVCDDRHFELIPCLDRNLIYQMRLKLDLSLMEHYERHCPLPERRYNCLIPPPAGYKVRIFLIFVCLFLADPNQVAKSRDEVWKANIPHTHLAHEKSDQNWMVVKVKRYFGAYLLSSDIITMSLAPNDVHQNQIQFALERNSCISWNQTVIWQKPLTNGCHKERTPVTRPPLCRSDDDPDAVWGVPMEACITPYSDHDHKSRGSELAPWPARATAPPPRLADFGYSKDIFEKDTEVWMQRVESYWNLLSPKITSDTLRNLMDMKANLGSFAAALKGKDVWVMNVVPEDGPNTLKLIYDRGLIGTIHNWCEAFSTYPRTYDLLHAWTVFSDIEKKGCSAEDLLIEMDRILRPTGFVIIRDKPSVIEFVKKYLTALHWEAVSNERDGDELVFYPKEDMADK
ncbi:hypothetical protein AAG906_022035 [Vitis piasezkii]